ncbi:MAG: protochlorophyllide oxidoreductase, partial [Dolichospermum sp.]
WGNRQKKDRTSFVQKVSPQARDDEKGKLMWELSARLVGLEKISQKSQSLV